MILLQRENTARSAVRNTTTNPAIMGISGNLMTFSADEEESEQHIFSYFLSFHVLITLYQYNFKLYTEMNCGITDCVNRPVTVTW